MFFEMVHFSQVELSFFFLNDRAPPEISPLPLHDALPIYHARGARVEHQLRVLARAHRLSRIRHRHSAYRPAEPLRDEIARPRARLGLAGGDDHFRPDRKSTRLNSSHSQISYAVFCLNKKK